jgi:hypothetical protein
LEHSVRRSELYTRETSGSEDDATSDLEVDVQREAQLRERLARIYGDLDVDFGALPPQERHGDKEGEREEQHEEKEHEFEFRLFSGQGNTGKKIVLRDEEEDIGDGAFLVGQRELGYFIVGKAEGERKRGFEVAALTGEDVLSLSKRRAWGLEVPWRVRVLRVPAKRKGDTADGGQKENVEVGIEEGHEEGKRKRPGKKRRIFLRERKKKRDTLVEQRKKEKEAKEEAEREKKTRKNREKKVKKKMKEKAKKAGAEADIGMDAGETSVAAVLIDTKQTSNG